MDAHSFYLTIAVFWKARNSNPFSAGTDFKGQNTLELGLLKSIPAQKE